MSRHLTGKYPALSQSKSRYYSRSDLRDIAKYNEEQYRAALNCRDLDETQLEQLIDLAAANQYLVMAGARYYDAGDHVKGRSMMQKGVDAIDAIVKQGGAQGRARLTPFAFQVHQMMSNPVMEALADQP